MVKIIAPQRRTAETGKDPAEELVIDRSPRERRSPAGHYPSAASWQPYWSSPSRSPALGRVGAPPQLGHAWRGDARASAGPPVALPAEVEHREFAGLSS